MICLEDRKMRKAKNIRSHLRPGGLYRRADLEKLSKLASQTLRVIGDDLAVELDDSKGGINLHKAAEVLPTLPRDEADVLISLLR